jgi:pimeloyl-ACP methyl ester carboxylesterase
VQVVGVRGTVNEVNWSLNRDRRGVPDPATGAILHAGFKRAADALYADLKPRLKPGYRTYLVGHSLGGAVAAILGIYLQRDGWAVERVVTFGQPRFTDAKGAAAFAGLPLVRVVNQNDIVPLLPDTIAGTGERFVQTGPAVVIYPGPYYAISPADSTAASAGAIRRYLLQASIPDHAMRFYEENLRGKDRRAERIDIADRERYIVRRWPNRFPPGAPGAPERRQNFVSGLGR